MGIFDDYGYFGKKDKRPWSEKIAGTRSGQTALGKSASKPTPVSKLPPTSKAGKGLNLDNLTAKGNRARLRAEANRPQPPSLMDQLMEQLAQTYQPPAPAGGGQGSDAYGNYMQTLDDALASRLGAINDVRNQAQQNYQTSDTNLTGMFGATANNIATQGSQKFGDIAQKHKAGLTQVRDESTNKLAADRDASMAKRQAMLQALGIEEAGGTPDPGTATLDNAISNITQKSDTALRGAEQAGATNQAFNQSVVNSVNQQGAERRGALTQQLQAIQNQLGMAEADAKGSVAQQKAQLQMQFQQANDAAESATNEQDYQIWRDRQNLVMDLWKTLSEQEQQTQEPLKVQGFQGLATDLVNGGIPKETAAGYMAALSEVLNSDYMKNIRPEDGYARSDIVGRRLQSEPYNLPPAIAQWIATNHSNLGNNAYYTAQQ